MKFPWESGGPLRVEMAFNSGMESPAWQDVSAAVKGQSGVKITRGGGGRHELPPAGRCSLTFDNRDGKFSDRAAYVTRTNLMLDPARTNAANPDGWNAGSIAVGGGAVATSAFSSNRLAPAGTVNTVSADVTNGTGASINFTISVRSTAGGSFGPADSRTVVAVPAGATMRVSSTDTVRVGADGFRVYLAGFTTTDGSIVVKNFLLEQSATVGTYFDGDTANTSTFTTRWTGTPGASTTDMLTVPTTLYRKRLRVSYRDPATPGNLLTAEDASFEGGTVGNWTGTSGASVANSAVRADVGTKSLLVTWPTAGANGSSGRLGLSSNPLVIGRQYTVRARVWIPAGSPAVRIAFVQNNFPFYGAQTATTGAWTDVTSTFTAINSQLVMVIRANAATTAGQQMWVDAVQVDEGTALGAFTTADPPISYRFTGRVANSAAAFPAANLSIAPVTATDEIAWQGPNFRTFLDVPAQETLSRDPVSLFRLEAGDRSDAAASGRPLTYAGTGATPDASDVPSSSASEAPGTQFSGGKYLTGLLGTAIDPYFPTGATLIATIRTTSTTASAVASLSDEFGEKITLSIDATGKAVATTTNPILPTYALTVTSAGTVNNGEPHVIAAKWDNTGVLTLYVDSATPVTATTGGVAGPQGASTRMSVGGARGFGSFTGIIANVAAFASPLTDAVVAELVAATLTGFQGESPSDRITRYNRWAGGPFGTVSSTAVVSQIGYDNSTGKGLTDLLEGVAQVEDGLVYVRGDGSLKVKGRSSFYTTASAFTIPGPGNGDANRLQDSVAYTFDPRWITNDVTGSRPGGPQQRVISSSSIDEYGRTTTSIDGPFASDEDLRAVIEWRLNTESTPTIVPEGVAVRLNQLNDADTASLLGVDLGDVIGWTGMPSQAPAATGTAVVLGIEETYTHDELRWEVALGPNFGGDVWILEDPVYGQINSTHRIAY